MPEELVRSPGQTRWLDEISRAEKREERWRKRSKAIVKRYSQQAEDVANTNKGERQFAILWANTETIEPAIYARAPSPVVSRRWRNANPVVRDATQILERGISYTLDVSDVHERLKAVRKDLALVGRGVIWFRYEAEFGEEPVVDSATGQPAIGEDGAPLTQDTLLEERIEADYVFREDFCHGPGRTWDEVPWVARRVFKTDEEGQKRWPETWVKAKVAMDHKVEGDKGDDGPGKATIYEVWSKVDGKVYFVAKSGGDVLEEREPLLKLNRFFPCPRPAFGTLTNDRLEPTPDFVMYQDQADEIDRLTRRIRKLEDSLKLVGFFPGGPSSEGHAAIKRALQPGVENEMIAIPSWAAFTEKGGANAIIWLPVDVVLKVLEGCVTLRRQLIEDVYQLSGISDIMRGSTEASETLGAQQLKSQWGSARIQHKQDEMARIGADCCRIIGEILAEAFSPETLLAMSDMKLPTRDELQRQAAIAAAMAPRPPAVMGMPPGAPGAPPGPPQPGVGHNGGPPMDAPPAQPATIDDVMELLRNDRLRGFVIDIETDSTIQADENAEKQRRTEFLAAVGGFLAQAKELMETSPVLGAMLGQMLLFGVRGFRAGRELEETIEKAVEQMTQATAQPQQPPPPDPKIEADRARAAASIEDTTLRMQARREDHAMSMTERQADHAATMRDAAIAAAQSPAQPQQGVQ